MLAHLKIRKFSLNQLLEHISCPRFEVVAKMHHACLVMMMVVMVVDDDDDFDYGDDGDDNFDDFDDGGN